MKARARAAVGVSERPGSLEMMEYESASILSLGDVMLGDCRD